MDDATATETNMEQQPPSDLWAATFARSQWRPIADTESSSEIPTASRYVIPDRASSPGPPKELTTVADRVHYHRDAATMSAAADMLGGLSLKHNETRAKKIAKRRAKQRKSVPKGTAAEAGSSKAQRSNESRTHLVAALAKSREKTGELTRAVEKLEAELVIMKTEYSRLCQDLRRVAYERGILREKNIALERAVNAGEAMRLE